MPLSKRTIETMINITLWILGTILLVALIGLALRARAAESLDSGYHSYVTEAGVLSFSDEGKRIPSRYKASAKQHTWAELAEKTASKETLMKFSDVEIYTPTAVPEPRTNPNWLTACLGHVTVDRIRVQDGEYNREMFVVRDECGRVISVTPQRPHIHINR